MQVIINEGYIAKNINFIFLDDEALLKMNREYLQHDNYTDIITFDLGVGNGKLEGEIYISVERVKENAAIFKTSFDNELYRVMVHGLLHLAGYNDKSKSGKKMMREKEDYYLNHQCFTWNNFKKQEKNAG